MQDDWPSSLYNPTSARYNPIGGNPGIDERAREWTTESEKNRSFSARAEIARAVIILFWIGLIAVGMWSEHPHHH